MLKIQPTHTYRFSFIGNSRRPDVLRITRGMACRLEYFTTDILDSFFICLIIKLSVDLPYPAFFLFGLLTIKSIQFYFVIVVNTFIMRPLAINCGEGRSNPQLQLYFIYIFLFLLVRVSL